MSREPHEQGGTSREETYLCREPHEQGTRLFREPHEQGTPLSKEHSEHGTPEPVSFQCLGVWEVEDSDRSTVT